MITKQQLRDGAWEAVKNREYAPVSVSGPGIVPGAGSRQPRVQRQGNRLPCEPHKTAKSGCCAATITGSGGRFPRFTKSSSRCPHSQTRICRLKYLLRLKTVIAIFNAAVEKVGKRTLSPKAPVFVALDDVPGKGSGALAGGLAAHAKWREEISVKSIAAKLPDQSDGIIERVKREFAERNEVDVSKVVVEFRIVA